ncbi:hypothetical protein HAX54_006935, partial [Datura stramonium]|nr:hypothetical protein [Datura stramonium]
MEGDGSREDGVRRCDGVFSGQQWPNLLVETTSRRGCDWWLFTVAVARGKEEGVEGVTDGWSSGVFRPAVDGFGGFSG